MLNSRILLPNLRYVFSVATGLFQANFIYGPTMYFWHPIYYFYEDSFQFINMDRVWQTLLYTWWNSMWPVVEYLRLNTASPLFYRV